MKEADPYRFQVSSTTSGKDKEYRLALEKYFEKSRGNNVEKLHNFPKYVPRQVLTRFLSRAEIFRKVLNVPGSIMECGVLLGGGLMTWAQLSAIYEPLNHPCRIVGFDLFTEPDDIEDIEESISLYDSNRFIGHIPKVSIVKGDICETAPSYIEENPHTVVRLLNLDANLYEPTATALDTFLPRMPKGAVIVFDEINAENCPGETMAVIDKLGLGSLKVERLQYDTFISYAIL